MPLKQPRFVHVQTPHADKRGFSVLLIDTSVSADAGSGAPVDVVNYRVSMCSKEDQFSRRAGRNQCEIAEAKSCRVVDLPHVLASLEARCYSVKLAARDKHTQRQMANKYAWVYKYFL